MQNETSRQGGGPRPDHEAAGELRQPQTSTPIYQELRTALAKLVAADPTGDATGPAAAGQRSPGPGSVEGPPGLEAHETAPWSTVVGLREATAALHAAHAARTDSPADSSPSDALAVLRATYLLLHALDHMLIHEIDAAALADPNTRPNDDNVAALAATLREVRDLVAASTFAAPADDRCPPFAD